MTILRLSKKAEMIETVRIQAWLAARGGFDPIAAEPVEMALYRSTLTKHGAEYDVLAEFPFSHQKL